MSCSGATDFTSVGKPLPNVHAYILDAAMELVPRGAIGELYVAAPSLAREYLHNPGETAERFLESPFARGMRLFRTGDLAQLLPGGEIKLHGRADRQVKIRAHRVELAEVERALELHPGIQEAIARTWGEGDEKRLIAYVVCRNGSPPTTSELRRYLKDCLPEFMLPSAFMILDRIPRGLNGKADVSMLPEPGSERPVLDTPFELPDSPVEAAVAEIWAELLGLDQVGALDDFFELGGDSLMAVRVSWRLAETFQTDLSSSVFADHSTVRSLARLLGGDVTGKPRGGFQELVSVARNHNSRIGINQEFMLSSQFSQEIRGISPSWALLGFGLALQGNLNVAVLHQALREMVRRHEILRTGFSPVAAVGTVSFRGWTTIKSLFERGPIKPPIRFEPVIISDGELPLSYEDLGGYAGDDQESAIEEVVVRSIGTSYDYTSPPLARVALIRTSNTQHRLIVGVSHLVFDGWSLRIFRKELTVLYAAFLESKGNPLPDLPLQYLDFADWQRQRLQGPRLTGLINYWADYYAQFPPLRASDLPFARAKDSVNRRGGVERIELDWGLCRDLRTFASAKRSTLYAVFLLAVTALLSVCAHRKKVGVVSYFANRVHPHLQNLIGDFATQHLVGVDFSEDVSITALMHQVRASVAGATANQEIPTNLLRHMLRKSGRIGDHEGSVGVTCEFIAHSPIASPASLAITPIGVLSNLSSRPAPQPLRFIWRESSPTDVTLTSHYHTDVLEQATVQRMLAILAKTLRGIVSEPNRTISQLSKWVDTI